MSNTNAKTDIFNLPVFPAAKVFPMLHEDELQELAADIKENGLREPLVLAKVDDKTMLIDGRNRRRACKIAKVVPTTRMLDGEDPTAYVLSANIHRRHMSKGQRAMAVAMIIPDGEKGPGSKTATITKIVSISPNYISQARTVLKFTPETAKQVLAGIVPLSEAYDDAIRAKTGTSAKDKQINDLAKKYKDLADQVLSGDITLANAKAKAEEREEDERQELKDCFGTIQRSLSNTSIFAIRERSDRFEELLKDKVSRKQFLAEYGGGEEAGGGEEKFLADRKRFKRGAERLLALLEELAHRSAKE